MAARPTWKGHLKISLVTVPIQVFPASTTAAKIQFNQLHRSCGSRIKQRKWCPSCDCETPNEDLIKGYEHTKGQYVTLEATEIESVKPESTRIIKIDRVADADAVDPIHIERSYYLAPDGPAGASAYGVMRDALAGKAGLGKVALSGREYTVAITPRGRGLLMFTLRHTDEVRNMNDVRELENLPEVANETEVALARQVLGTLPQSVDMSDFKDTYQSKLRDIIDAKMSGTVYIADAPAPANDVGDLMAALRKSLDASTARADAA